MSSFTAPLVLEAVETERDGQGEFLLYVPFSYDVGYLGSGDTVTVPAGYKTDLCSVPWLARAFIPIAGPMAKPAILHDWLIDHDDPRAADIFDEALGVARVSRPLRWVMVLVVRTWQRVKRVWR